MEFHNYTTHYQTIKKTNKNLTQEALIESSRKCPDSHPHMIAETNWLNNNKPYFSIYPSMVRALEKVNLNVNCKHITWPKGLKDEPFVIRFPATNCVPIFNEKGIRLESILVSSTDNMTNFDTDGMRGILIYPYFGLLNFDGVELPNTYWLSFPLVDDLTVEDSMNKFVGNAEYVDMLKKCLKYVIGVILISTNDEYTLPEVLSKHKERYDATKDAALVDKAKRNGKFGWSIGQKLESQNSTHVRIPHLSIRHTGPGGSVPVLTPIKGSIVNRKKFVAQRDADELG